MKRLLSMKRLLISLMGLLSMGLPMWGAVGKEFKYSYPDTEDLPFNLGYMDSVYDLGESDVEGWRVKFLNDPISLTYHVTSEEDKTVEVIFDPSYLELVDIVIPAVAIDPETGEEYTVTAIGKMAFDDCPQIRSVIMSDSITRIEDFAFNMCENKILHHLGYVKFSKNLTHIGNYAFKNCHNLTTGHYTEGDQHPIVVLNFLRNVDYPIYGYAGRLTGVDDYLLLPPSVTYIGKHAFEGCYFERSDNQLNYGLCKVKIPNPSCVIDDYAFAGCKFLELITIGEELTYEGLKYPTPTVTEKGRIGDHAFANCNLMRLDIPSSIESIGENAFINCFTKKREKTSRSTDGRVYFDALNWFFPRSLFNNESDQWHSWNFANESTNNPGIADTDLTKFKEEYEKYLNRWHTNTVTIHSDRTNIGLNAFANNPQLEKVFIKGSAGEIGSGAFSNCTQLSEVEFPEGLSRVSSGTFRNCDALKSITIPDNVTEIGDSAFYQCRNLQTIVLPSKLKKVNPYTFYKCEKLELSELPDEVSAIANHAFYGCQTISSLRIPDSVTTIGDYAFADCYMHAGRRVPDGYEYFYGLVEVKIGDNVTSIGGNAFDGCRHLGQIEFGNSVTTIGDHAFRNCMSCPEMSHDSHYNPSPVILPNTLTAIGTGAFEGCSHLPEITLSENMTELPEYAFAYCSNLYSIGNLDSIETASKTAFIGCSSLEDFGDLYGSKDWEFEDGIFYNSDHTEVMSALPNISEAIIPEGVTRIHDEAFADCVGLTYVEFPESLEVIGARAFANCTELREYYIYPTSLREIGTRAFENCVNLGYAELFDVKMGEFVYAGCTGIGKVYITADFTQDLQDNWFAGCINMQYIEVDDENTVYSSDGQLLMNKAGTILLRAPSGIDNLYDLPETVTEIGEYAVSNCFYLYEVVLPSTVTHIGAHAFDNCYLSDGNHDDGLYYIEFENPAVTIGEYAFNNCENLSYVIWSGDPETEATGSIGAYAFNNCRNLTFEEYNLDSAAIGSLEPYAFANLEGIQNIVLPETLDSISDHAFEACKNLTSVIFPEGLKKIGNSAFRSCGLVSLDLPDSIEEIGDSAFMNCTKVMDLKLPANLKKINPYTFYKCFSGGEFDTEPEDNFNLKITIPDAVESIGDYAFYGCAVSSNKFNAGKEFYSNNYYYYFYGLLSVSMGQNVSSIGKHAFDGCFNLVEVNMNDAVSSIGNYAFKDCFKERFNGVRVVELNLSGTTDNPINSYPVVWELEEYTPQPISLPNDLQSLGEGAFSGCAELPYINFPASLTAIPAMAFNGCKNLPEIKLGDQVTSIGNSAFSGCSGVKEIHLPACLNEGSRAFVDCEQAFDVYYYAEDPKSFDEGFFSPKVYASNDAVINTPNALLQDVKGKNPWGLFYRIIAKDETLVHLERALETKNGLRFRILSNKPNPYCEVAGPAKPADGPITYDVPEYVNNIDETSEYFGVPYKVIRIGNDAFENDMTLVGISIPTTVFDIGQEAFNGCKNLPEINLPNSITNMGERAFANCYGLTYFEVPPLVTRLNPEVLRDCRGLYSIRMHDDIEELGMGALMDCRHLRAFERSENWNLRIIDDYALKNCIELETINIPEGVQKIGKEAMYYCQKLNTVTLPKSMMQIGEKAFDDCEILHTIRIYTETIPEIVGEANLTEPHCKIYVQAKCLDAYKDLWKVHEHRIEPGIYVTQPTRKEMPEYIPGNTHKIASGMPLEGQTMTWDSFNPMVATPDPAHDGTFHLNAVGPAHIKVLTDQHYYHECELDVYPQLADANWDGRFDISDPVNIANYAVKNPGVLNNWWLTNRTDFESQREWERFYFVGSDVNKDESISISDASAAIKKVLAQSPAEVASARSKARNIQDGSEIDALEIGIINNGCIPLLLSNSIEYVALQADIHIPDGMEVKEVKAGSRLRGHAISTNRIDANTLRIVLFNFANNAFAEETGSLVELAVNGRDLRSEDIQISNIIASDLASNSYALSYRLGGIITGAGSIQNGHPEIEYSNDGIIVHNAAGKGIGVYTLDGHTLRTSVGGSDSEFIPLDQGIYIITVEDSSIKIVIE